MSGNFETVKTYLQDMDILIVDEDPGEELVVVENEEEGIKNLIIDCEDPILIIEQLIMKLKPDCDPDFFKWLLKINRELVHGAFVLDGDGEMLLFRDTLQLENLDYNELDASVKALSLAMSEYGPELLKYAANC
ncbi:MAG: YbjN domain-containing protein [Thermodesulfobacteriota bacterium]